MRLLKVKEKPAQSLRPACVFLWNNFVFLFFQWKKYCHHICSRHHVWHKQLLKQRLSWQSHRFWISWQIFPNHRTNINVKYRQLSSNVAFKKKNPTDSKPQPQQQHQQKQLSALLFFPSPIHPTIHHSWGTCLHQTANGSARNNSSNNSFLLSFFMNTWTHLLMHWIFWTAGTRP